MRLASSKKVKGRLLVAALPLLLAAAGTGAGTAAAAAPGARLGPASPVSARGEAVVLWNRWCSGSPTCGMYASILQMRPSRPVRGGGPGKGVLAGAIRFVGGPAPPPRGRPPSAGWVHVESPGGRVLALVHVRSDHRFHLTLRAGRYRVYGSQTRKGGTLGCSRQTVRVRSARTTHVRLAIGCLAA